MKDNSHSLHGIKALVASLVQKSEAKIIPGAGHFAMIEAAPAVNHEIQTFATHLAS